MSCVTNRIVMPNSSRTRRTRSSRSPRVWASTDAKGSAISTIEGCEARAPGAGARALGESRREGLSRQRERGVGGEGPRDRDALLHPSRELPGVVVDEASEAD